MAKRKFTLTDKERRELLRAYELSKNVGTRTRYQAVRLYGEGYPVAEIEKITGCARASLMEWCREYHRMAHKVLWISVSVATARS